jgi:hypothetical protein
VGGFPASGDLVDPTLSDEWWAPMLTLFVLSSVAQVVAAALAGEQVLVLSRA